MSHLFELHTHFAAGALWLPEHVVHPDDALARIKGAAVGPLERTATQRNSPAAMRLPYCNATAML